MACEPGRQAHELWRELAPEHWPLPWTLLPAGSALVGGAVRDGLLGRLGPRPDLDLVVPVDAIDLARRLGRQLGGSCVVLDPERSIARLVLRGWTIDLARRAGEDLEADLVRRDYTVNAIALPLPSAGDTAGPDPADLPLIDPCGGLADLAAGRLVAISEANLLADPLRLLRGIRLATELGFGIAPSTWELIRRHHAAIASVAGERVLTELERLAAMAEGQRGLAQALEAGLLQPWGGIATTADRLEPLGPDRPAACGLTPEEGTWALPLARLAAVLDGAALERLRASRRLQRRCRQLRHWHEQLLERGAARLDSLAEGERLELQRQLEEDLPALLLQLDPAEAHQALRRWRDPDDRLFHPRPPVDGRWLQEHLPMAPGPRLGVLIDHLTRERAFGRLAQSQPGLSDDGEAGASALAAARRWLDQQSGHPEPDPRRD